ncbi:MAG: hypothetical protein ACFFBD_06990 [Candidatus Hodarchaeota archaeon]
MSSDSSKQEKDKAIKLLAVGLKGMQEGINTLGKRIESLEKNQLDEFRQIHNKIEKLQIQMESLVQQIGRELGKIQEVTSQRIEQTRAQVRTVESEIRPLRTEVKTPRTEPRTPREELRQIKTEVRSATPEVITTRTQASRIPATEDVGVDEGSQRTFRADIASLLGPEKASGYDLGSPKKVVQALTNTIEEISAVGNDGNVNISEIISKYAAHKREEEQSAEEVVIRRYGSDIRKILESGQAILAGIGHKRVLTRRTMEGAKNLARKFARKEDVIEGVPMILELLEELEKAYES